MLDANKSILLAFLAVCQHGAVALFQDAPSVVDAILREDNVDQIAQQAASLYPAAQFPGQSFSNEIIPPLVGQQLDNAILAAAPQGFDQMLAQPPALEPTIVAGNAMQAAIDMFSTSPINTNMINTQQRGIADIPPMVAVAAPAPPLPPAPPTMPFPGVRTPPLPVPTPPNLGYTAPPAPLVEQPEEHQGGVEAPAPPPLLVLPRKKSAPVTEKGKDAGVREAKDVRWHADFSSGLFAKAVPQETFGYDRPRQVTSLVALTAEETEARESEEARVMESVARPGSAWAFLESLAEGVLR